MVEFQQIVKSYGGRKVIENLTLSCLPGRVQCLVGKNGAGKSTLVNISTGLMRPDSGHVRILGEDICDGDRTVVQNVGYVLEKPFYIERFSASEQLQFMGELYKIQNLQARIEELLDFFELPTDNKKRIYEYSSGMRSKVSLACALIHSPEVLILDEPFTGSDLGSFDKQLNFLKDYVSKGNTILITTHLVDVIVEIGDFTAILKDGHLLLNLSFDEIQRNASHYGVEERFPIKRFLRETLESGSG